MAFSIQRSAFSWRNDMVVIDPPIVEPFDCAESLMAFAVYGRAYRGRLERLIKRVTSQASATREAPVRTEPHPTRAEISYP